MIWFRRQLRPWALTVGCSLLLSACTVYRGPVAEGPEQALSRAQLESALTEFEYYDAIEVVFIDGSMARRQFHSVRDGHLKTFKGRGGSRQEYSDPFATISEVRHREFAEGRTIAIVVPVTLVVLFVLYVRALAEGLGSTN